MLMEEYGTDGFSLRSASLDDLMDQTTSSGAGLKDTSLIDPEPVATITSGQEVYYMLT